MNDSAEAPADAASDFGLIDVIEAFTALRHEARNQSKEARQLTAAMADAAAQIDRWGQKIETTSQSLLSSVNRLDVEDQSRRLAMTLCELDHHLSRVNQTVAQQTENPAEFRIAARMRETFNRRGPIARRLASWLYRDMETILGAPVGDDAMKTMQSGLALLTDRVRKSLREHEIERIETLGQPFDGEHMLAIGTVSSGSLSSGSLSSGSLSSGALSSGTLSSGASSLGDVPSGHVAEQLSPAYRWRGQWIRTSEVRVAL